MTFDYTDCWNLQNSTSMDNLTFSSMPSYSYDLRSSDSGKSITPPSYAYFYDPTASPNQTHSCVIKFDIVADLQAPVLQYYKLTNFYQNNRRYVQSLDTSQLEGQYVDASTLSGSNCKPLAVTSDGKGIYPCGLIANSLFNGTSSALLIIAPEFTMHYSDTISGFRPVSDSSGASDYNFTQTGIAWPGEAKKYSATSGYVGKLDEIVPPPNWALRYPNNYSADSPPPDLTQDEHFQNWMRTAGLPTFSKLYGRNDTSTLPAGQYQVQIYYSELCGWGYSHVAHSFLRLSGTRLQRNQITRNLHCFLDRRQEPLLGMGLCGSGRHICASRARRHHSSPLQTSVCCSLPCNRFRWANRDVDVWETCRSFLGIDRQLRVTSVFEARRRNANTPYPIHRISLLPCNTALRPTDYCTSNCNIYCGRFTMQGIKVLLDPVLLTGEMGRIQPPHK